MRYKNIDKEELEDLYLHKLLSIREIAKYLSINPGTVIDRLKWYNIPKRKHIQKLSLRKIKDGKKYCPVCKKMVYLDNYTKNITSSTGYGNACKNCNKMRSKEQYAKNRDKILQKCKEKYDPVKKKKYNQWYRHVNHDKIAVYKKAYRKTDAKKESDKRYVMKNHEKVKKRLRLYRNTVKANRPWLLSYWSMRKRCIQKGRKDHASYYDKGIKSLITSDELKNMWFKHGANLMEIPVLHRKDTNGDYTIDNAIFIPRKLHHKFEKMTIKDQENKHTEVISDLRKKGIFFKYKTYAKTQTINAK